MNNNVDEAIMQGTVITETAVSSKDTRAERRRQLKEAEKEAKKEKKKREAEAVAARKASRDAEKNKTSDSDDILKKVEEIRKNMKASTWKDLEVNGKFTRNQKIFFIKSDTLVIGCDVGSETHYFRAFSDKGIELTRNAVKFKNSREGYNQIREWALHLAAANEKTQIVVALEPTGHYWYTLCEFLVANNISVVQVNPYATKVTKEVGDNSQNKDDRKDPGVIASLAIQGNYGMPYLPEDTYAELRECSLLRDQMMGEKICAVNRLHRLVKMYFPEFLEVFPDMQGVFGLQLLATYPLPEDILKAGKEGIREAWKAKKLRGRGYSAVDKIMEQAKVSIGRSHGKASARMAIKMLAEDIGMYESRIAEIEKEQKALMDKLPKAKNVLEISGIGDTILTGILTEIGDIRRFDSVKEIQKISGLGLVACSSGKHKGQTKISKRGRKRLRYWLFQAAKSVVVYSPEFKEIYNYYQIREENPLKKMQALIAVACKLLRVIYVMLTKGCKYDGAKMMASIVRPEKKQAQTA